MSTAQNAPRNVIILGSGVIGLTIAHVLSSLPSNPYNITVVAKDLIDNLDSQGWASPWAGANWSPIGDYDERKYKWESRTFNKLWEMIPTGLVMELPSRVYSSSGDDKDLDKIWFRDLVRDFRVLSDEKLPPNVKASIAFTTVSVNPAVYLPWLKSELDSRGVHFLHRKVDSLQEAAELGGLDCVVINATGLGSRSLLDVQDITMYPIRGQTTVVYAPEVKTCIMVRPDVETPIGEATYIIPLPSPPGTVLLGGTFQPNNWDTSLDIPTAKRILSRCAAIEPTLLSSETKILSYGVGLRPAREAGARVEVEWIDVPTDNPFVPTRSSLGENEGKRRIKVIHAYGFGPAGYQNSWGAAEEVVDLILSI